MAEIHCLAGLTHHAEREEHERHAIEKVADISVSLAVDEQDSDEEDRPYEVGYVEREARRHYPCGESGADIGTHNHRNGLRQSEQTGIDWTATVSSIPVNIPERRLVVIALRMWRN